jgi:hypothetical protein
VNDDNFETNTYLESMRRAMESPPVTEEQRCEAELLTRLLGRLLVTIDADGEPFYPVGHITLSNPTKAEIAAGAVRKWILWLDPKSAIHDGEGIYLPHDLAGHA